MDRIESSGLSSIPSRENCRRFIALDLEARDSITREWSKLHSSQGGCASMDMLLQYCRYFNELQRPLSILKSIPVAKEMAPRISLLAVISVVVAISTIMAPVAAVPAPPPPPPPPHHPPPPPPKPTKPQDQLCPKLNHNLHYSYRNQYL